MGAPGAGHGRLRERRAARVSRRARGAARIRRRGRGGAEAVLRCRPISAADAAAAAPAAAAAGVQSSTPGADSCRGWLMFVSVPYKLGLRLTASAPPPIIARRLGRRARRIGWRRRPGRRRRRPGRRRRRRRGPVCARRPATAAAAAARWRRLAVVDRLRRYPRRTPWWSSAVVQRALLLRGPHRPEHVQRRPRRDAQSPQVRRRQLHQRVVVDAPLAEQGQQLGRESEHVEDLCYQTIVALLALVRAFLRRGVT